MTDDKSFIRNLLSSTLKAHVKSFLGSSVCKPLRDFYNGTGSVLMYHRITEFRDYSLEWRDPSVFMPHLGLSVSAERFEEQMRFLSERTTPISIGEIELAFRQEKREKPFVVVTFDDGYLDNFELALPIAEKYGIPFTVFVSTGYIERTWVPWWVYLEEYLRAHDTIELPFLDHPELKASSPQAKQYIFDQLNDSFRLKTVEDQCKALAELGESEIIRRLNSLFLSVEQLNEFASHPLVTIGAHTVNHPALSVEEESIARAEMAESIDRLEELTGTRPDTLAYPFGDRQACGRREAEIAKDLGLKVAFTTRSGHVFPEHAAERYLVPRLTIDYFDDSESFERKILGVESLCENPLARIETE